MSSFCTTTLFLLLTMDVMALSIEDEAKITTWACAGKRNCNLDTDTARKEAVRMVREALASATMWTRTSMSLYEQSKVASADSGLSDCKKLYEDSDYRLQSLVLPHGRDDALAWLSGALTSHMTCLDGLRETGHVLPLETAAQNLTMFLQRALALYEKQASENARMPTASTSDEGTSGFLVSWDATSSKTDYVVAKDGTGNYKTINEAIKALAQRGHQQDRAVIYVKSGIYAENVEIKKEMKNVIFVGDGMDKTIVTGSRNVKDGASTYDSATFIVAGDGFWAKDVTFQNTAGPEKHQAVALTSASDLSVFYRCSFEGYQDTLLVHSQRQFYRDCHIYGTIDFIFGNAAAVLQNCDIFVRRPMDHQANMITAQGRTDDNQPTGICIHMCRVAPTSDFETVKGSFKTFLGRPWKEYSRTVFLKTDLDNLIHPNGWTEWNGNFALSTLFYGEYMNSGVGASTNQRVKWPGFHVLKDAKEAMPFTVSSFIQGDSWIPASGVPFSPGL